MEVVFFCIRECPFVAEDCPCQEFMSAYFGENRRPEKHFEGRYPTQYDVCLLEVTQTYSSIDSGH